MREYLKHVMIGLALVCNTAVSMQTASANTTQRPVINEILASHTGTDNTEFIELYGTPGMPLQGLSVIVVEGDASIAGNIDRRIDLQLGDDIGSNGFYLIGNPDGLADNYDVLPNLSIANNSLENSSLTVALVETASLSGNQVSGSESVLDAVAITDGGSGDIFYFDAPVIGPDGSFFPAGVRRIEDGVDTDSAADWTVGDFFLQSANTPQGGDTPTPGPSGSYAIYEIQGAGHISPLLGRTVTTSGVVTALAFNGFYLQDPAGDGDDHTSDGIFVFTGGAPTVAVGEQVSLAADVSEYIAGGAATGNLSVTQLTNAVITATTPGSGLPAPMVIGRSGRVPPNVLVIGKNETEPPINLQDPADAAANPFNPESDGIDFYESLEGMLVTIEDPVAVSATRTFSSFSSELFALANNGKDVAPKNARTKRGGISLQPDLDNRGDQNPERVQIQFDGTLFPESVPAVPVGSRLENVTGVVGYSFGNFEVNAVAGFDFEPKKRVTPEVTRLTARKSQVTVASYNVLNLSPDASDDNQRASIASQIVHNLRSPDVIALQEIQDNSGETDDGTTAADVTLTALVDAIIAAGGPNYAAFDVAPQDGASGGVPGGNIRNAFLYNPERVRLQHYQSLTPDILASANVGNPDAFDGTRDPLLAVFEFNGKAFTVINNHWTSRFGSSPIFGGPQPFVQAGEAAREGQAQALNDYVDASLKQNHKARIIVLGDLNTFEFTDDLAYLLPGRKPWSYPWHAIGKKLHPGHRGILENLIHRIRDDNVYTFIFDGNSQALDHVFVTRSLAARAELDIVHVNVDFPRVDDAVASDHEPLVARFYLQHGKSKRH